MVPEESLSPAEAAVRILHVDRALEWRGGQRQLLLSRGPQRAGIQQQVACAEAGLLRSALPEDVPQVHLPPGWSLSGMLSSRAAARSQDLRLLTAPMPTSCASDFVSPGSSTGGSTFHFGGRSLDGNTAKPGCTSASRRPSSRCSREAESPSVAAWWCMTASSHPRQRRQPH